MSQKNYSTKTGEKKHLEEKGSSRKVMELRMKREEPDERKEESLITIANPYLSCSDKSKGEQVMLHLDCIGIEVKSQRYEGRGVQVSPDEQEAVLIMEKRTGKRFFTFYSGKRSSE